MFKRLFVLFMTLMLCGCNPMFVQDSNDKYYCDDIYSGMGEGAVSHTEVVHCDRHSEESLYLYLLCPYYEGIITNGCAPAAGSILISYYDITCSNLIPDYEPGFFWNNKYYYNGLDEYNTEVMKELSILMGTDTIQPGTSVNQFKTGLTKYVNNHGYNLSLNNVGQQFNIATAKNYISQQQPIVLFLNSYDYYSFIGVTVKDKEISMTGITKTIGHVVVAYGYQEFNYYNDSGLFRTDKFLIVSFGDGTNGYLKINDINSIDEAYAVSIY